MKEPNDGDLNERMTRDPPSSERLLGLMALLTIGGAIVIVGVAALMGAMG